MSGVVPKKLRYEKNETWSRTVTTMIRRQPDHDPGGDDHLRTPGRRGPPVATWTKSSPRMSAKGSYVDALVICCSPIVASLTSPIGIPTGNADEIAPLLQPAVTTISPSRTAWSCR